MKKPCASVRTSLPMVTYDKCVQTIGGEKVSNRNYYEMCRGGVGRPVRITTRDGRTHTGMIHRVTNSRVYLQPFGQGNRGNYGGFAYPWGRRGYGYGYGGFAAGIAIGAIIGLAFLPFFLW